MGTAPTTRHGHDRRRYARYPVTSFRVDYSDGENFLYAPIDNISEMGIFIRTDTLLPEGTRLSLSFALEGGTEKLALEGEVAWLSRPRSQDTARGPAGMGVRFIRLSAEQRESIVDLVRALAYLQ